MFESAQGFKELCYASPTKEASEEELERIECIIEKYEPYYDVAKQQMLEVAQLQAKERRAINDKEESKARLDSLPFGQEDGITPLNTRKRDDMKKCDSSEDEELDESDAEKEKYDGSAKWFRNRLKDPALVVHLFLEELVELRQRLDEECERSEELQKELTEQTKVRQADTEIMYRQSIDFYIELLRKIGKTVGIGPLEWSSEPARYTELIISKIHMDGKQCVHECLSARDEPEFEG